MGGSTQHGAPTDERCPRCKQPAELQQTRCPHCGQPINGITRRVPLWIGVGGVGAILFAVLLMWLVVYNEDVMKAPVPVDPEAVSPQPLVAPENTHESSDKVAPKEEPKQAPAPEKPPPLDR